jgi:hypothetical protein
MPVSYRQPLCPIDMCVLGRMMRTGDLLTLGQLVKKEYPNSVKPAANLPAKGLAMARVCGV